MKPQQTNLSAPPAGEIAWEARLRDSQEPPVIVRAQTWVVARQLAAVALQQEPGHVQVVPAENEEDGIEKEHPTP